MPYREELYRIANHIASAKGALPDEWQPWAAEIESDLRELVSRERDGQEPIAGADECDREVFEKGKSACLVAISKDDAETICRGISAATGCKIDWHYVGGRVHIKALVAEPPAPVVPDDYFSSLVAAARIRADKAMTKFPQPNYVLNKVAEESGEVIKAVIHYTEGREQWSSVECELIDNLAMLIRLVKEGDQVIGFTPPDACRIGYSPALWGSRKP